MVEGVESRTLLSVWMGVASAIGAAASTGSLHFIQLDGTLRGHYRANDSLPDAGTTFVTTGSGHVRGIGRTSVTGELHGTGFIFRGSSQGDLTLKGAEGTIDLHLTGVPEQGGFQGLPSVFSFSITGGTGKYRQARESGSATVLMTPGQAGAGSSSAARGTFSLVLTPRALPL
jgi:hypothetical protein